MLKFDRLRSGILLGAVGFGLMHVSVCGGWCVRLCLSVVYVWCVFGIYLLRCCSVLHFDPSCMVKISSLIRAIVMF